MNNHLFNIDFTRVEAILFSLLPAFINLIIFIYVLIGYKKSKTDSSFLFFVLLLSLWQVTDGFIQLSITKDVAEKWNLISVKFLLFFIPFGNLFVLRFTGYIKKLTGNKAIMILFLPAFVFYILVELGFSEFTLVQSNHWFWIANLHPTIINHIIFLWISLGGISMLTMLWLKFFAVKGNDLKAKSLLWMACGLSVPVITGVIVEILFPMVFGLDNIPLTVPLLTIFSLATVISINKFKMMDFSPRNQWEKVIETMNEGIVILNNDHRIKYANETFCRLTEYSFEEIKDKAVLELFLTDLKEMKNILSILEERKQMKSSQYEMKIRTKSGKLKWLLISGAPYLNENGDIVGSISVQTDITMLKEAESALTENELRLRIAQSVAHVGSWEWNFSDKNAIWSEEALRIYGVPLEQKEQNFESWLSFIHPADLEWVKKEIAKSEANHSDSSIVHRIICRNGTEKYIHSVSKYKFNAQGQVIGLYGICHDITEQKIAEQAAIESEARISTFINESLLAIYFADPNTKKILYANKALAELLGYTQEELKEIEVYDFIVHSREDVEERLQDVMKMKRISNGERLWKRKDGKVINVLVSSFYQNKNGREEIYVAAQDITLRKNAENSLEEINKELETFIYKASHDIRGPLASVIGLINVSKLEITEPLALKYLDMIGIATRKLDYVLIELVKAMKIKGTEMFNDEIQFKSLIPELLSRYQHTVGYSKLLISTKIDVSDKFVSNRFILETILQNLIENTIKYQRSTNNASFLNIIVSENQAGIEIRIEDNGIGIEKSLQSRVFDMYFRGVDDGKGSGLGLYLVKKGIEKLKGKIELESEKGRGTVFIIQLYREAPAKKQPIEINNLNKAVDMI